MALTLSVLLLLLLLALGRSTDSGEQPAPTDSPMHLHYELPPVTYETPASYSAGPISILFQMVHLFVHVVQPNSFPEDIVRKIIKKEFELSADYDKVIYYEMGVIICAVLGLLFIILMPVVGYFFCLCRCCNKCGGKMHQRQKESGPFRRKYFAVSLLVISIIISIGILFAFFANLHMRTRIQRTQKLADSNLNDFRTLLDQIPKQVDYIVDQFNVTKERGFSDLDNINKVLGENIRDVLGSKVIPVLDEVKAMVTAIKETKAALEDMESSVQSLKQASEHLNNNLTTVKRNMEVTLSSSECSSEPMQQICDNIRASLGQLEGTPGLDELPSVESELKNIDDILATNLDDLVDQGYAFFDNIPEDVKAQTEGIIRDAKRLLNGVSSEIKKVAKMLPIQGMLSNVTGYINDTETYIHQNLQKVETYDSYWWLGTLITCFLPTLIVVFFYLGLFCGVWGFDEHATPTSRGCVSNTGGIFLMVGVGFTFLFCWLLMILVVLTFTIGVNMQKLVCEPYANRQLFQILDTPYLLNKEWEYYISGMVLKNPNVKLTFEQVYSDCKNDIGIYTTLKLDNFFNVSEHLNIEKYTGNISSKLENMNLNFDKTVLLDEETRKKLQTFANSGIQGIDFDAFLTQTDQAPVKVNLLSFADDLEEKVNPLPSGNVKDDLQGQADTIRKIHYEQVLPMEQSLSNLKETVMTVQRTSSGLQDKVNNVLDSVDSAQNFIENNTEDIIAEEVKKYAKILLGHFERYIQWVKETITEKMGSCKPVATALDSVINVVLCGYIVHPLNLFWFGIGQATMLLLPAVIFAVKLAKYYRRMNSEDVYDDGEILPMKTMENGNNGYHKDHLYGVHNPVMTSAPRC
ncbi:PREDICTED: prominin-1 isoform X2 [Chinchilla lanigera]|uniref:Prominin 1 n=1 Tax=Chinchilla lanigera TaxID=34839 RepID=A0A8C2UJ68_CHILA|nr:PREDICTED: prominin-1 isoform X2 [Chinchilla lanigera]